MKRKPTILAALLLTGCIGPTPIDIEADRAFYSAVASEYVRYVQADPTLDAQQKELRMRTIEVHGLLLDRREGGVRR